VLADPAFRELVLFTPPHRQAVAIEPYTCSADAANLAERGIDSGWRVLPAGSEWEAAVEYRWVPSGS
jgi:aldose 1-epimerase